MEATCLAVLMGVIIGLGMVIFQDSSDTDTELYNLPGLAMTRLIHFGTLPLIVTGVIRELGHSTFQIPSTIFRQAMVYFCCTTLLSMITGLTSALLIEPGVNITATEYKLPVPTIDSVCDIFRNMFPVDVQIFFTRSETKLEEFDGHIVPEVQLVDGQNTLGLIFLSFVFGMLMKKEVGKLEFMYSILTTFNISLQRVLKRSLWVFPLAMLFHSVSMVIQLYDLVSVYCLAKFVATVLIGHLIHAGIILPLVYLVCMRRNPYTLFSCDMLPCSCRCCGRNADHISPTPMWTGTVLYEVVVAVSVAQFNGLTLDLVRIVTIMLSVTALSIKAAGFPETGSAKTVFLLVALDFSVREVPAFMLLECLLDQCTIVVNILGQRVCAALVNHHLPQTEVEQH